MKQLKEVLRELKVLENANQEFNLQGLPNNPSVLFVEWLNKAIEEKVQEPHAMTLSTVDKAGAPDARVLILKDVKQNCWYFASSAKSRKGEQMEANANVALTFYWSDLARQVRIRGVAKKMPPEESAKDFLQRSIGAKAITIMGNQSKELLDVEDVDKALEKAFQLVEERPNAISSNWNLYKVEANEVEFWQGDSERKHKRIQYNRQGDKWNYRYLWP